MVTRDQFKTVLTDDKKVDELIKQLGVQDLVPLLVKYSGLEKIKGDELKAKFGSNTREKNRNAIRLILEKDSLTSYKALSQVLQFKNQYVWTTMFPFAKGTHKELVIQPLHSRPTQPAADQPSVIWLCADDHIFTWAAGTYAKSDTPLKSSVLGLLKYYELPSLNDYDVNVWLCKPSSGNLSSINLLKLYQTYNKTEYCILTGTCKATHEPAYQPGDICVTKRSRACTTAFVASLEEKTEEWERRNDMEDWYCQRRKNNYSKVMFGKVGGNYLDNNMDFLSEEALRFCESSEDAYKKGTKTKHTAILMATEEGRSNEKCGCGDTSISHVVKYSENVVRHLVETLTLSKCRSGRPSFQ